MSKDTPKFDIIYSWQFSINEQRIHTCIFKLYCHRFLILGKFVFILIANKSFVDIGGIVNHHCLNFGFIKETNKQVLKTFPSPLRRCSVEDFMFVIFTHAHTQIIEVILTPVLKLCLFKKSLTFYLIESPR